MHDKWLGPTSVVRCPLSDSLRCFLGIEWKRSGPVVEFQTG
jgi:hypothetical protein